MAVSSASCRLVVAANGVAYLPHEARPGIIPRLLQEILSTRIMVKAAMKSTPASNKVLQVSLALAHWRNTSASV